MKNSVPSIIKIKNEKYYYIRETITQTNFKNIKVKEIILDLKDLSYHPEYIIYQVYIDNSWYYVCSKKYEYYVYNVILVNDIELIYKNSDIKFIHNVDLPDKLGMGKRILEFKEKKNELTYITNPKYIEVNNFPDLKDYIKNYL